MATRILVVGGAGYVGAHTAKCLSLSGFAPIVFDNLSTGNRDFVRWGPLIEGDIHDSAVIADSLRQWDIEAVLHFAACADVRESVAEPEKYYKNNVQGTISLLRGMRLAGCEQLVFSSTCAVYGGTAGFPITESTIPNPVNPYGASKLMAERILADYRSAYGFRSIALRYFNAAGADFDGELGEKRNPESHLIPRAMMALQGHLADFAVFGADFNTPDGTAVRDYIHVVDLAQAHVLALQRLLDGHDTGFYNLGSGRGYSVRQVLEKIEEITGLAVPTVSGSRQPGEPEVLVADVTLAQRELGFFSPRSDLDSIIGSAWAWHLAAHPRRDTFSGSYG